jgi:hypothetical protein
MVFMPWLDNLKLMLKAGYGVHRSRGVLMLGPNSYPRRQLLHCAVPEAWCACLQVMLPTLATVAAEAADRRHVRSSGMCHPVRSSARSIRLCSEH